jgi:hypothetical protein
MVERVVILTVETAGDRSASTWRGSNNEPSIAISSVQFLFTDLLSQ